jgi:sec-independent protein translocase protein TatA
MDLMSITHWLVVLAIVLVLFGAGKLPTVMGDLAKGIKAFKTGISETRHPSSDPTLYLVRHRRWQTHRA